MAFDPLSFIIGQQTAKASGGGSGDYSDVHFVTFMSEDGSTELYKRPVADGDDCADPVIRGLISEPPKESTAQYNYTHVGWSATPNGALDENILKSVTTDKTVYANYAAVLRHYTVNFYDGETLIESKSLAYGSTPVIEPPMKEGYSFDSWQPELETVKRNIDYYAKWTEKVNFAGGSWADIAKVCEAGEASEYFAVGDSRTITIGEKNITLRIIGINHDDLSDGSGKAGITVFAETPLDNTFSLTSGWNVLASQMITTLKPQLPSDLQAVIKHVYKKCDDISLTNQVITPTDVKFDLFPLSWDELKILRHGGRTSSDSDWRNIIAELGTPYQYYINKHNSVYKGPYTSPWTGATNTWYRQSFRMAEPNCGYLYHSPTLVTKGSSWAKIDHNITDASIKRKVLFAFCI